MTECPNCGEADPSMCECPYDREGALIAVGDLVKPDDLPPYVVDRFVCGNIAVGEGGAFIAADLERIDA